MSCHLSAQHNHWYLIWLEVPCRSPSAGCRLMGHDLTIPPLFPTARFKLQQQELLPCPQFTAVTEHSLVHPSKARISSCKGDWKHGSFYTWRPPITFRIVVPHWAENWMLHWTHLCSADKSILGRKSHAPVPRVHLEFLWSQHSSLFLNEASV